MIFNTRNKRNNLLRESDKYILQDYPINEYQRSLVINYRKELRNFFQTSVAFNWVFTLESQEFPALPNFPDLTKIPIYSSNNEINYLDMLTSNIISL